MSVEIIELIEVVDEIGRVVQTYEHRPDPRFYVLINIPPEAASVTRVRQLPETEAAMALEHMRAADKRLGGKVSPR